MYFQLFMLIVIWFFLVKA